MGEYIPQIQISANDPVCSTSSLEGTIIGILFDKKGHEIKDAINVRGALIEEKIAEFKLMAEKTESFIVEKRQILKELDNLYQERLDEKRAFLIPYKRELEDITKRAEDKVSDFDRETLKRLGERAVVFEKGFEDFKCNFQELDDFLKKEKDVIPEVFCDFDNGEDCIRGISGMKGDPGMKGDSGLYTQAMGIRKTGNLGIGNISPEKILELMTEDEDKAIARLKTLQNLLKVNVDKLESLKFGIKKLKDEHRRLLLILRNIDSERTYKLDLNKLSAFGFEDLEIE